MNKKFVKLIFIFIFILFTGCSNKNFPTKNNKISLNNVIEISKIKTKNFYGYKIPDSLKITWIKEYLSFQVYLKYKNWTVIKVNILPYLTNFIKNLVIKYKLSYIFPYYTLNFKNKIFFDNLNLKNNLLIINKKNKLNKIIKQKIFYIIINNKYVEINKLKIYITTIPFNLKNKIINFNNLLLYIKNIKIFKKKNNPNNLNKIFN